MSTNSQPALIKRYRAPRVTEQERQQWWDDHYIKGMSIEEITLADPLCHSTSTIKENIAIANGQERTNHQKGNGKTRKNNYGKRPDEETKQRISNDTRKTSDVAKAYGISPETVRRYRKLYPPQQEQAKPEPEPQTEPKPWPKNIEEVITEIIKDNLPPTSIWRRIQYLLTNR